VTERVLTFGAGDALVGVLTLPLSGPVEARPAVVLLNAGILPRVGPNRLYVDLARRLASRGFPVLRFDLSGVGESPSRPDGLPAERAVVEETRAALDRLERELGARRFVLGGLCAGASVSLMTAREDARVIGTMLVNAREHLLPEAQHREANLDLWRRASARHMLRLATRSSFRLHIAWRVATGQVDYAPALRSLLGVFRRAPAHAAPSVSASSDRERPDTRASLRVLTARGVRVLHVYVEADEGLDYLQTALGEEWRTPLGPEGDEVRVIEGANHQFTTGWSREELIRTLEEWLERLPEGG